MIIHGQVTCVLAFILFTGDVSTEIRLECDLFVWQEKESHLKKLRETFDMETEQETREAKRDKESAIK